MVPVGGCCGYLRALLKAQFLTQKLYGLCSFFCREVVGIENQQFWSLYRPNLRSTIGHRCLKWNISAFKNICIFRKISQKLNCFRSEFKFHWCNFNGSTNETKLLWKNSAKDWKFCTQFHTDSYCIHDKWWYMVAFLPQIWLSNEGSTITRTLMWSLQHHTTVAMVYAVLYFMQDSSF